MSSVNDIMLPGGLRVTETQRRWVVRAALAIFLTIVWLRTKPYADYALAMNNRYIIADWLINYQGGFIRRGLIGEMFFRLSQWTSIPVGRLINVTQLAGYAAFFWFAARGLDAQRRLWPFLPLIAAPFVFLFQLHDPDGGFRKEILHFVLLAALAWQAVVADERRFRVVAAVVLLLYPALILTHEMLAVYLPYVAAVILVRLGVSRDVLQWLALLLLPSVITFLVVLRFPGSPQQVMEICMALGQAAPDQCNGNSAIGWLQRPLQDGMAAVQARMRHAHYLPRYLHYTALCLLAFLPLLGRLRALWRVQLATLFVLISIAGTLPMFAVALGWGRFIYIHGVSLFLLLLAVAPRAGDSVVSTTGARLLERYAVFIAPIYLIVVFAYAAAWRLPHYF